MNILIATLILLQTAHADIFSVKDTATCPVTFVYWWSDSEQVTQTVSVDCKVRKVTEVYYYEGVPTQLMQIDCANFISKNESTTPGIGLVKGHKMNRVRQWVSAQWCVNLLELK